MTVAVELIPFFTSEAIKDAYWEYKARKTDLYHSDLVKIPMGADGITWQDFERNLDRNTQNISRRVLNGSYQFYPFREVDVSKPSGGVRTLSVACIRDALVQRQLYTALYDSAERLFAQRPVDRVSFAYRKGKSAPKAAARVWASINNRGYWFALDADVVKFFDHLDHDRMMNLIEEWLGRESLPGKLMWHYLRTDRVPYASYKDEEGRERYFMKHRPRRLPRKIGVPQGGVLSGLLANLYLHEFDWWVMSEQKRRHDLEYFRYADDFVMLTRDSSTAVNLYEPVKRKLEELRLELHPLGSEKANIRDIRHEGLVFVGFEFTEKNVRAKPQNISRFKTRFKTALAREPLLQSRSDQWFDRLSLAVAWCANPKVTGPLPEVCPNCGLPKDRSRSWMAFFASVVSDENQIRQLDRWIRTKISQHFFKQYGVRIGRRELRCAGLRSLFGQYWTMKRAKGEICRCDLTAINPRISP